MPAFIIQSELLINVGRQETWRIRRDQGTTAGEKKRFLPDLFDHGHNVYCAPTAKVRVVGRGTALSLLDRHPGGLQFC